MSTPAENRRRIALLQAAPSKGPGAKGEKRNSGTPSPEARRRFKGGK